MVTESLIAAVREATATALVDVQMQHTEELRRVRMVEENALRQRVKALTTVEKRLSNWTVPDASGDPTQQMELSQLTQLTQLTKGEGSEEIAEAVIVEREKVMLLSKRQELTRLLVRSFDTFRKRVLGRALARWAIFTSNQFCNIALDVLLAQDRAARCVCRILTLALKGRGLRVDKALRRWHLFSIHKRYFERTVHERRQTVSMKDQHATLNTKLQAMQEELMQERRKVLQLTSEVTLSSSSLNVVLFRTLSC